MFIRLLTVGLLALGCQTTEPEIKYVYVDMDTYMKWGSKKLVPIGTREVPDKAEIKRTEVWEERGRKPKK